jgi:hypothetical protein
VDAVSQILPEFFISRAGAHPADVAMAAKVGAIIEANGHQGRVVLIWQATIALPSGCTRSIARPNNSASVVSWRLFHPSLVPGKRKGNPSSRVIAA